MINWYKAYDEESKDQPFKQVKYSKYSPYSEDCIFTAHYFEEIKHNFQKFELGHVELTLNNDHFCSKCQGQLLKQSQTLCTIFKTESLLCDIESLQDLAQRAVRFFEAERFYYFSFWNAVVNDKQFLLTRLKHSYMRFYRFLIELNACLMPATKDPRFESATYKELQAFLVGSYRVLLLEVEHFDYLYQDFVKIIKTTLEICTKLTENIQFIISRYDAKEGPIERLLSGDVAVSKPPEFPERLATILTQSKSAEEKPGTKQQGSDPGESGSEADSVSGSAADKSKERVRPDIDKVIDMGIVKKNLRKVFHEKKLQRYQKQKQKLDQQLLNKGRREMNSLKQYFAANLERQSDNLYQYTEILAKHHLNNAEPKTGSRFHMTMASEAGKLGETRESLAGSPRMPSKSKSLFENKEYRESPNNPNYRYERIVRMMEEKKRKNLDDYVNSVAVEYLQMTRASWVDLLAPPEQENAGKKSGRKEQTKGMPRSPPGAERRAIRRPNITIQDEGENARANDASPTTRPKLEKKHSFGEAPREGSEVSDESVFTDEESKQETDITKNAIVKLALEKYKKINMEQQNKPRREEPGPEMPQDFWDEEGEKKKKKKREGKEDEKSKVDDWITRLNFNELIRQKKFEIIPKKTGMRAAIDKKPNKYRDLAGNKQDVSRDGNSDFAI